MMNVFLNGFKINFCLHEDLPVFYPSANRFWPKFESPFKMILKSYRPSLYYEGKSGAHYIFIAPAATVELIINEFHIAVTKRNKLSPCFSISVIFFIPQEKPKFLFQILRYQIDCHHRNGAPWK